MIIEADSNQQLKRQLVKQAEGVIAAACKGSGLCRNSSNQGEVTWQVCH